MKVCLLTNVASIHSRRWIEAALKEGFEVLVVSPQAFPNNYPDVFVYENEPTKNAIAQTIRKLLIVRIIRRLHKVINAAFLLQRNFGLRFVFRYIPDLYDISRGLGTSPSDISKAEQKLKQFNPDILHVHNINIPLYQWLIIKNFRKTKLVVTVWGDDIEEQSFKHSLLSRLIKGKILKRADLITAASKRLANLTKDYVTNGRINVKVIPFGVDLKLFTPKVVKLKSRLTIGTVRHLHHIYGIDLIIKATSLIKNRNIRNIRVIIAGDGDKVPYQKMAKDLGLADNIEFVGKIVHRDVPKLLKRLDIFLIPSRFETFGVAAVEAQAAGVPVIGTKTGGIPEVVKDRGTGLLVPPDDYQSLARAINELASNPGRLEKMSKRAPQFVSEKYDWDKNTKQMFGLYRQLFAKVSK